MPPFEEMDLHQTAVLWEATGDYDAWGRPVVSSDPEEISCRWEEGRSQTTDEQGNTITLEATVVVSDEIPVQSRLYLGTLSEFSGTGSVGDDTEVMVVVTQRGTPSIHNRVQRRTLGLQKWKDSTGPQG